MGVFPAVPTLPSTPMYPRPNSPGSLVQTRPRMFHGLASTLTPLASPQPLTHKPTMVLDTDISEADSMYYPSTPPLSSSGSAISSPGSFDMLQTPLNPMFSGLDGVGGKEVCNVDNLAESFPTLDWSSCTSPPMTPVYLQSQQAPAPSRLGSLISRTNTELLSATASCASVPPSPVPFARTLSSSSNASFCDPRNLTVGTVNPALSPDYSELPALGAADDEDHEFVQASAPGPAPGALSPSSTFEFGAPLHPSLPFAELDDFESVNDFVNGLVNLGEQHAIQASRSRANSDAESLDHSSFTCDDDFEELEGDSYAAKRFPSPADSSEDFDSRQSKRQKMDSAEPAMNSATESQSGSTQQQSTPPAENQNNDASQANNGSESNSNSDNAPHTPLAAPTNRRGRKQSLTEDPSKTFVCELCNRRFRRQEHLKRHYRSLHTQDKPYECHECGKKFSRSDNLAQHSRTHGSGAIVMSLIDDPDAMAAAGYGTYHHMHHLGGAEDYGALGKVLFQVTAEIPGSASELSSDEGSDGSNKKRKHSE